MTKQVDESAVPAYILKRLTRFKTSPSDTLDFSYELWSDKEKLNTLDSELLPDQGFALLTLRDQNLKALPEALCTRTDIDCLDLVGNPLETLPPELPQKLIIDSAQWFRLSEQIEPAQIQGFRLLKAHADRYEGLD